MARELYRRRKSPLIPRGRLQTISRVAESIFKATGRTASDEEIAAMLATSVKHIQRARARGVANGR